MGIPHYGLIAPVLEPFAPLAALLLAVLAVLFVYQIVTIIRLFVDNVVRPAPLIGSTVAPWIDRNLGRIANAIHAWGEQLLKPLTDTVNHVDNRLRRWARASTLTHQAALAAIARVRYDAIPAAQQAVLAVVSARLAALLAQLQTTATQLQHYAQALQAAALRYTDDRAAQLGGLLRGLETELRQAIGATAAYARQLTVSAITRADSETARAVQAAQAEDAAVAAYAQQLAGQGLQYSQQQARQSQAYAQLLSQQSTAYAQQVGTVLETGLLTLGAALGGRIGAIEQSDCQQQCRQLGQLGRDLQALDLGILLAILLEASTHPQEGARALHSMLDPGGKAAASQLASLFR